MKSSRKVNTFLLLWEIVLMLAACNTQLVPQLKYAELTGVSFTPRFSTTVTHYSGETTFETSSLKISAIAANKNIAIYYRINGQGYTYLINGDYSENLPLAPGNNKIEILAVVHEKIATYTFDVTRKLKGTAALSGLTISTGVIEPTFDPAVNQYTLALPNKIKNIYLKPVAGDETFRITASLNSGDSFDLSSDKYSNPLKIGVGSHSLVVRTTQDNFYPSEYTIRVIKYENADLKGVTLSTGELVPEITPTISRYLINVENARFITLGVTPEDRDASVFMYKNGTPSERIDGAGNRFSFDLGDDPGVYTLLVRAIDGYRRYYTLTFSRNGERDTQEKTTITTLKNNELYLASVEFQAFFKYEYFLKIEPPFNKDCHQYETYIDKEVKQIKVFPQSYPLDAGIKVRLNEGRFSIVQSGGAVTCNVVDTSKINKIEIVVTNDSQTENYSFQLKPFK